jgi:hypothetical protein
MLAGAALLAMADAIPAMAHDAPVIGETYMTEQADKQKALSMCKAHFNTLKTNNPQLKETLDQYDLSYGSVGGGMRNNVKVAYGACLMHAKGANYDERMIGVIGGGKKLPSIESLEQTYPGVLAVIPAEKEMTYDRFKEYYNTYVVKLRAEK